jgi:hypothetical protein
LKRGKKTYPSSDEHHRRPKVSNALIVGNRLRRLPSRVEAEGLVRRCIDNCLWRQEIHRAETGGIDHFDHHEIKRMGEEEARELDALFRFGTRLIAPKQKAAIGRILIGDEPIDKYRPIIESAAREMGVSADSSTVAGRLFERTIMRGYGPALLVTHGQQRK